MAGIWAFLVYIAGMLKKTAKHNVRLLRWFNFFLDFRPYGPIAVIYFSQVTGSFALGLSVFAVASVAASIFEVPTGVLSDRIGRKRTMIVGALASVLAVSAYAVGGAFWMLAMGSVFQGLAVAFFSGNNDALLYDSLKSEGREEEYAELLGKVSAMFQVGLAVSALIGGFVADWSLQFVFVIAVVPQAVCLILSFFFKEPAKHYEEVATNIFEHLKIALRGFRDNWKLRDLSLSAIISHAVGETVHQFVPAFFAMLWPTWALGIPRTLSHVFGATSFHFAGRVIKKFGALRVMFTNTFINRTIGFLAYGFPNMLSPLLVSTGSLTYGLFKVSENTLMQKEFTNQQRATMASLNSLFGNLFFAIFAFGFGTLADGLGPAKSLLIGEAILLVLIPIYGRLLKRAG